MHKSFYFNSSVCLSQVFEKYKKMKFFIIIALSVALCMAAPAEDAQILRYEVSFIKIKQITNKKNFNLFIEKDIKIGCKKIGANLISQNKFFECLNLMQKIS